MLRPCLFGLALCLSLVSIAVAARPTGYAIEAPDEVEVQNLPCSDLELFLTKQGGFNLEQVVEDIMNQPQYTLDTSLTVIGSGLMQRIMTASPEAPPCKFVVSKTLKETRYRDDPDACGGDGTHGEAAIVSRGMANSVIAPSIHAGELTLLSEFERGAKMRNCAAR